MHACAAPARVAFVDGGQRYEAARCARLEGRLVAPGELPPEIRELAGLVVVEADA